MSKEEIRRIVEGYEASGMTRRAYCEKHGIRMTTLDYWRRMYQSKPKLVRVKVQPAETGAGFILVLANGRRIESSWSFADPELSRLIRVAESA